MDTGPKIIRRNGNTVIDPNPENHAVNHEDLYIYASLVAKTRGRSFLTEDPQNDLELENVNVSTVDMVISDTATFQDEKRQFLTTAWTNIGGSQTQDVNRSGDLEGFGITNVDIEIKSSYIPRVVIDFVDIRGATLFEQGSCSPYSLFFHLPYPIFELTLKGYYGKPVTYFLNLQKFNTKFNSETGNFECKAEFIGWSYAFLADMLMGYIRCANYMTGTQWGAREKLRGKYDETMKYYIDNGLYDESDYYTDDPNSVTIQNSNQLQPFCRRVAGDVIQCKTISNLLQDIEKIKEFLGRAKGDDNYQEVANLIRVRDAINQMKGDIRDFCLKIERDHPGTHTTRLTQARNPDGTVRNIKELYVFTEAPNETLELTIRDSWFRPIKDNEASGFGEIASNVPIIKGINVISKPNLDVCGGAYVDVASQMSVNNGLTGCDDIETDDSELRFATLDYLDGSNIKFQNGMMNNPSLGLVYKNQDSGLSGVDFYIDVGWLTSKLDENLGKLDAKIQSKRNALKEEIDSGILKQLGFRPTIRNVFTILACNTENFMQLLLDVCVQAEEHHNSKERKTEYNGKFADGNERLLVLKNKGDEERNIYPWPTYYKRDFKSTASYNSSEKEETKELYPGTNSDFNTWPEVQFVEDFIEACDKLNEADEELDPNKDNQPGYDNRFPINPLESLVYGKVELKYREKLTSLLDSGTIDDVARKIIAERMFITLDFSLFGEHRGNIFNRGLGYSIPNDDDKRWWKSQALETYKNNSDDENWVKTMARIDAHNLLSCITDPDIVSRIQVNIANGAPLKTQLSILLKKETGNVTEPFKNDNDDAKFQDDFMYHAPGDTNTLTALPNGTADGNEKHWLYQPKDGYIRLLGNGSEDGLGTEGDYNEIKIYSDISKMPAEYLFQLIDEEEYDGLVSDSGISLGYTEGAEGSATDEIKKQRENLEEILVKSTQHASKQCNSATKTAMSAGWKIDDSTKNILFNGDDKTAKRMFSTLGVGSRRGKEAIELDIFGGTETPIYQYSTAMVYPTSDNNNLSSKFMSGYGNMKQAQFPMQSNLFMFNGYADRTAAFTGCDVIGTYTGLMNESIFPLYPITLQTPGEGFLYKAKLTSANGVENYGESHQSKTQDYTTRMGDVKLNTQEKRNWADTITFDTLITSPLWLDNVNKWRFATTSPLGQYNSPRTGKSDWGYKRPLSNTINDSKYFRLKSGPKDVYKENSPQRDKDYSSNDIEARNLAYIFLQSCKFTPFITCPLNIEERNAAWPEEADDADSIYNIKKNHYPKALRPFITTAGVLKLPKGWVYSIGAVMWRWRQFMGCNTDSNGNIRWRHPNFGEEPKGFDPLSQPGHPGIAQEIGNSSYDKTTPHSGKGHNFTDTGGSPGRLNRSRTEDITGVGTSVGGYSYDGVSYMNTLFKDQKQLWSQNITTKDYLQISSFSRGVTRSDAITRATSAAGGPMSNIVNQGRAPYQMALSTSWDPTLTELNAPCFGPYFDYWGAYQNDLYLSKTAPASLKNSQSALKFKKPDELHPWNPLLDDIDYSTTCAGAWGYMAVNFVNMGHNGKGENDNYGYLSNARTFGEEDATAHSYLNREMDQYGCPTHIGYRSSPEAAANSFWPFLWIAPWQHFYTEPIGENGLTGAENTTSVTTANDENTHVEQIATYIPYDFPYRDYVGNFGALGNNGNYWSEETVGEQIFQHEIPNEFLMKTIVRVKNVDSIEQPTGNSPIFKTFNVTSPTSFNPISASLMYNLEGGKYAELMAILPTFVKELFVQKFESWVDSDWRKSGLRVVDPVNFKKVNSADITPEGIKHWTEEESPGVPRVNLFGQSYRANQYAKSEGDYSLRDLIADPVAEELFDSVTNIGSLSFTPAGRCTNPEEGAIDLSDQLGLGYYQELDDCFPNIPSLSIEKDLEVKNEKDIKSLFEGLFNEYYMAIVPTPRLFALDVFSNRPLNGGMSIGTTITSPVGYGYWDGYASTYSEKNLQSFIVKEAAVEAYTDAFQSELKAYCIKKREELTVENTEDSPTVLNDDDIKLSLYRSFKSICDKWISTTRQKKSSKPSFFFNIIKSSTIDKVTGSANVPLAGHFSYVNRVMGEIGNKAVLDIVELDKIPENPKMSLYNLISNLLGENNFDFFPLPSFSNFTSDKSDEALKDMFRTDTNYISKASGPNFICLYVGGSSRSVDLKPKPGCDLDQKDMGYQDDGFSLSEPTEEKPLEFLSPEEKLFDDNDSRDGEYYADGRIEGKGYTAFKVAYGIENQNMFKSVELDQAEFSETNESLMVIDRLADGGNPANKTNKGNNLHNLYLTRSYTCTVESLGNMMIQPLQYFELTNIPMFYGTYLITEVKHNVKPHYIGTTFKGVRQPIVTVPIVEDVATAMAMTLKGIDAEKSDALRPGTRGSGGGGPQTPVTITGQKVDVDGIEYIDMGANDPSEYINHRWTITNKVRVEGRTPPFNRDVDTIVLHWTAGWTFKQALKTLSDRGVHYHYIAAEDGTLVQVSDIKRRAWHAGNACGEGAKGHEGLNARSIGINYAGGVESGWCKDGSVIAYMRTPEQWNQDTLKPPFCPKGIKLEKIGGGNYAVCSDTNKYPSKCFGGGVTYSPKKQFGAMIKAAILAKKTHPNIKRITSHHWITTRKQDLGDRFPWGEFLAALRATDPTGGWDEVEIWSNVPNNCPGKGGGTVRDVATQEVSLSDVDIDLDMSGGALDVELSGNAGTSPGNGVTGKRSATKVKKQSNNVQKALKFAGKI